jgi:hypothetical protein
VGSSGAAITAVEIAEGLIARGGRGPGGGVRRSGGDVYALIGTVAAVANPTRLPARSSRASPQLSRGVTSALLLGCRSRTGAGQNAKITGLARSIAPAQRVYGPGSRHTPRK